MCGLVGVLGYLDTKDETLIRRLLVFDYFRGTDSTGLAVINKGANDSEVVKIASHPLDLMDMGKFKLLTKNAYMSSAYIGHNRAATVGKVSSANAHPFKVGSITGAHNGTLSTNSFLELKKLIGFDTTTDSEAIFTAIDMFGIEAVVPVLQGAWALVWHDATDGTMNFLKNKERPLWFAWSKDMKKLLWASEHPILSAATSAGFTTAYELFEEGKKGYKFFSFSDDTHYSFKMDQFSATMTGKPKFSAVTRKGKEPAPVMYGYTGTQNFHGSSGGTTLGHSHSSTATKTSTTHRGTEADQYFEFWDSAENPFGSVLSISEFNAITAYGCSFCGAEIDSRDKGITIFKDEDLCLCSVCSGNKPNEPKTRIYVPSLAFARQLNAESAALKKQSVQ